ncbi:MAG: HAD family hydrolase [Bacteroidetes bacterium HGW-Bacteroidetes-4]|jgi:HAD superfamily hydrolase (TIGR01509 family)|nr:MAG: HAD family hydrolase [Bacteroidetes bacterium HGW-Bacteroidetes-4]
MKFKGIIFDFNGTLLLDSPLHEEAWITMAAKLRSKPLSIAEFQQYGHGRTNKAIITYLLGREPEQTELEYIVEEKESQYRTMCLNHPETFCLAPGVIPFLNEIKSAGIPITIATGSYKPNVDFYFKQLNLDVWFDRSRVVLDDGTYPGKPAPDIFFLAAQKLNLPVNDCLVFEDSYSGIQAAYEAGVAKILAVEPTLEKSKIAHPINNLVYCKGFSEIKLDFLKQI